MISNSTKILCLIVFTLTASGCGSSGGDSDIGDPQIVTAQTLVDDPVNTDGITTTEVTVNTETNDGLATPVVSVSSAKMDEYIRNPLVTMVPSELEIGSANPRAKSYVTNPLIN